MGVRQWQVQRIATVGLMTRYIVGSSNLFYNINRLDMSKAFRLLKTLTLELAFLPVWSYCLRKYL